MVNPADLASLTESGLVSLGVLNEVTRLTTGLRQSGQWVRGGRLTGRRKSNPRLHDGQASSKFSAM